MAQIKLDDGTVLEVGAVAGFTTHATQRSGEPLCLLAIEFEVTPLQMGTYGKELHAKVTSKWDDTRKARRERLAELKKEGGAA